MRPNETRLTNSFLFLAIGGGANISRSFWVAMANGQRRFFDKQDDIENVAKNIEKLNDGRRSIGHISRSNFVRFANISGINFAMS